MTMTSYPMPSPGIHNKSGSKPLMRNPIPFFPTHMALPRCHVHITWPGQQTNRPGKKRHPYHR
jgi:hypothetical protein